MSNTIFFESPNHVNVASTSPINKVKLNQNSSPVKSPSKRGYLTNMSPNISRRIISIPECEKPSLPPRTLSSSAILDNTSSRNNNMLSTGNITVQNTLENKKQNSRFERPTMSHNLRPYLPDLNVRSASTTSIFTRSDGNSKTKLLRRTNSLISQGGSLSSSDNQQQSSTTSSDRFIPSRHNSSTGKLSKNETVIHPNASPETHIKAQTSKIYQHHVAEACGLEVNSRVLQFQPLPPDRKRPVNLFEHVSSTTNSSSKLILNGKQLLKPSVASARAKKVPTAPERVLDAPGIIDDFYLNLLAWSSTNLLAIGLEDAVYVWNASTGSVGLLCELNTIATSIKWSNDGSYISIGRNDGLVEIWDIETNTKLRTLNCEHGTRVAAQSWQMHILTSGSRIGHLYNSDVRVPQHFINENRTAHSAEICGISYKQDGNQFCTGGNDNLVCLWDVRNSMSSSQNSQPKPVFTKSNHKAAVKAIAWCPFQSSLLATGGGSSDKTIHFWNTSTGARVNTIETGSQISSLNWGYATGIGMEIVATHGFPTNNISIFNYPTLQKTGEIMNAHDSRILGGCLSPDSLTLATVAGDENLKFWSLFDLFKTKKRTTHVNETMGSDEKRIKKLMNIR